MNKGSKTILNAPLFFMPHGMNGIADVLEREKGKSIFGSYHYVVKEIKSATNIKLGHRLQGAFYNHILGKIQDYTPEKFYLINGESVESSHDFDSHEIELFDALKGIRKILNGDKKITPSYNSIKYGPWSTYCNDQAIKINDISLVDGIGPSKREKLIAIGLKKVNHLSSCSEEKLKSIKGIGESTVKKIKYHSKALIDGKPQRKTAEKINLPKVTTEIFLDLEGSGSSPEGSELVEMDYLIGVVVRKGKKQEYIPFTANNTHKEKEMLLNFLKFIKKQKNYVIYHWHSYEKTHLTNMMEKYSIDDKTAQLVLSDNVRIDLHRVATSRFAFPTYSTSIKSIAKWMGFKWRHKEVDAVESIVMYLDYVNNPKLNQKKLKMIQDYNEDDCMATLKIKDWLIKNG